MYTDPSATYTFIFYSLTVAYLADANCNMVAINFWQGLEVSSCK